jgi:hypothetical protein
VRLRGSRPNATSLLREDDLIDIDFLTGNRLERRPTSARCRCRWAAVETVTPLARSDVTYIHGLSRPLDSTRAVSYRPFRASALSFVFAYGVLEAGKGIRTSHRMTTASASAAPRLARHLATTNRSGIATQFIAAPGESEFSKLKC